MVPKAKKNLHACGYHLGNLLRSKHFEELEINFAAFVNSARSTTFVLQKEFKKNPRFIEWYGDPDKPDKAPSGTKLYEMKNDELCKFFIEIRNQIVKEGINNLNCSTKIESLNSSKDFPDRPAEASIEIGSQGVYYRIQKGTAKEDIIPAISKTARIMTTIYIANAPGHHLGQSIPNSNLVNISQLYYKYLENLVEEWTGIANSSA